MGVRGWDLTSNQTILSQLGIPEFDDSPRKPYPSVEWMGSMIWGWRREKGREGTLGLIFKFIIIKLILKIKKEKKGQVQAIICFYYFISFVYKQYLHVATQTIKLDLVVHI